MRASPVVGLAVVGACSSGPPPRPPVAAPVAIGPAVSLVGDPACEAVAAFLAAVDGDDAAARAFHAKYIQGAPDAPPVDGAAPFFAGLRDDTGGFVPRRIVEPATCRVLAQRRADGLWSEIALSVADGHVVDFALGPGLPAAADAPPPRDDEELARQLIAVADRRAASGRFSGSVVVSHRGKVVLARAWGLASRAYGVANRPDTRFNLGSMNKMFTAVSVLQLVEQGKVSLDDTVGKWLTDWPNADVRDKVTIRMLLTHSSGLGSYWNDEFERRKLGIRAVADYFPTFAEEPLQFAPGARFGYSNAGFIVLGAIVEKASGQDYFDYVRQHVYAPAGMNHTDCYDLADDIPDLAIGYTHQGPRERDPRRWFNNLFLHVVKGGPAGGGYSTGPDLVRFAGALRGGVLLRPESLAMMSAKQIATEDPAGAGYGFGMQRWDVRGHLAFGHTGGFPGIDASLAIVPDGDWVIAVLSNQDLGGMAIAGFARDLVTR